MRRLVQRYAAIERGSLQLIAAEFFLQITNAVFTYAQALYMKGMGFDDGTIASYTSIRFLGILATTFPLGMLIRGRPLRPFVTVGVLGVPLAGLCIVASISYKIPTLIFISQILWGASFNCVQISTLPYILRSHQNQPDHTRTAAFSLHHATWSLAMILSGLVGKALQWIDPRIFDDRMLLILASLCGFFGYSFARKMPAQEPVDDEAQQKSYRQVFADADWPLLLKVMIAPTIISIGAGMTIPFLGLFFSEIHSFSTSDYGLLSSITAVFVSASMLLVPSIKQRFGYKIAMPTTQFAAIFMLVALALTQFLAGTTTGALLAALFFALRQPLMNLAGPMTSDFVMEFVGKKHHEMVSALNAGIWSGSWFISGILFKSMRDAQLPYMDVLLITAAFYTFGVLWYAYLLWYGKPATAQSTAQSHA